MNYWVSQVPTQGRAAVRDAIAYSGESPARMSNLWGTAANDTERTGAFGQDLYYAILSLSFKIESTVSTQGKLDGSVLSINPKSGFLQPNDTPAIFWLLTTKAASE